MLQDPKHQERALSVGISSSINILRDQVEKDKVHPYILLILSSFLAYPTSHKDFVKLGGVKLLLVVLANEKYRRGILKSLCNIAGSSDETLRVIASEPALIEQMEIICKEGPENCK